MSGRGAWSGSGRGGTLRRLADESTPPGPYYLLATGGVPRVGSAARDTMRAGHTPSLDTLAVMYGVKAIQRLLNATGDWALAIDGVFGRGTDNAVRVYQNNQRLTKDGSVGPHTMKVLLLPHIRKLGGVLWTTVYGLLKNEGAFDPGAVGTIDEHDLGLAQINGPAHPEMSMAQRFDPFVAIQFNVDYIHHAQAELGNLRDAILAYNLGIGGVRTWISKGRPRYYSPDGGPVRDTTAYVDHVLNAYKEL
jgi:peptidoglycan hydrolase-like protein with peptidoglycan-binding domain